MNYINKRVSSAKRPAWRLIDWLLKTLKGVKKERREEKNEIWWEEEKLIGNGGRVSMWVCACVRVCGTGEISHSARLLHGQYGGLEEQGNCQSLASPEVASAGVTREEPEIVSVNRPTLGEIEPPLPLSPICIISRSVVILAGHLHISSHWLACLNWLLAGLNSRITEWYSMVETNQLTGRVPVSLSVRERVSWQRITFLFSLFSLSESFFVFTRNTRPSTIDCLARQPVIQEPEQQSHSRWVNNPLNQWTNTGYNSYILPVAWRMIISQCVIRTVDAGPGDIDLSLSLPFYLENPSAITRILHK